MRVPAATAARIVSTAARHVAEQERVVPGQRALEEAARARRRRSRAARGRTRSARRPRARARARAHRPAGTAAIVQPPCSMGGSRVRAGVGRHHARIAANWAYNSAHAPPRRHPRRRSSRSPAPPRPARRGCRRSRPGVIVRGVVRRRPDVRAGAGAARQRFARPIRVVYGEPELGRVTRSSSAPARRRRAPSARRSRPGREPRSRSTSAGRARRSGGFVGAVARRRSTEPAVDATLVGVGATGPVISDEKPGVAVDADDAAAQARRAAPAEPAPPLVVLTRPVDGDADARDVRAR